MKIEYKQDEFGKIIEVTASGKAVKKSFMNALKKAQDTKYWELYTQGRSVRGQFSDIALSGLGYSIYVWTKNWYGDYSMGYGATKCVTPIQTFDNMRYFLAYLHPDAYDLI